MKDYRVKAGSILKSVRFDHDDCKKTNQGIENAKAIRSMPIALQGMDTIGKDGTIKNVMSSVNPRSCRVASFKVPSRRSGA